MADFDVRSILLKSFLACAPFATVHTAFASDSVNSPTTDAVIDTVRYRIQYPKGKYTFDPGLDHNRAVLDSILNKANIIRGDSLLSASGLTVLGAASPDGPVKLNLELSELRAEDIIKMLPDYGVRLKVEILPLSWGTVIDLAEADPNLPYREETLTALYFLDREGIEKASRTNILRGICYGVPYQYLAKNIFPKLRYTEIVLAVKHSEPSPEPQVEEDNKMEIGSINWIEGETVETVVAEEVVMKHRPFLMDIRINMLYDVAALPNVGVEFWLGGNFSIGLNWQYAWWSKTDRSRFWRAYGGDINSRWWFGKTAKQKPLSGHHLGVYGQMLTYDVEWGGLGYMGGEPGENMWHRMNWGAGVEYGYSLPVSKYFNIDFTAGIGYFGGKYYEYKPFDGHFVWQRTRRLNWFGPTKAEISLVWLLGNSRIRKQSSQSSNVIPTEF